MRPAKLIFKRTSLYYNISLQIKKGRELMQKFNCHTCGAELYWDAEVGALKCKYCDSVFQPSDFEDATINADPTVDTTIDAAYTNSQEAAIEGMVVYKCTNCGAEVVTSETTMATTCAYCGRAISLTNKSAGEFRPDKVLPFKITKEKATDIYKKYIKSSPLIPKLFSEEQTIQKMQGLYVPFFLHSANLDASCNIQAENIQSSRRGDDKVEHHSVYRIDLDMNGSYEKIPTDASKKIENKLMDNLEPFDLKVLTDFNPAFMAGYFAEQPDEKAEDTIDRASNRMESAMKEKMKEVAGNYSQKTMTSYRGDFLNKSAEYVMLPIWLLNVEYKEQMYTFAINGDTGKAVGKLPISKPKMAAWTAASFFGSQLVFILLNLLSM